MRVPELLLVPHVDGAGDELIRRVAAARETRVRRVRRFAGESLPPYDEVTAIVVLGGPMGAYEVEQHPFLSDEMRFIAAAVRAGTPVLGICLGAQLLATALGGAGYVGEAGLEAGLIELTVEPTDWADLFGPPGTRYFSFHSDSFTLPPGAQVLARSERYLQAFAMGESLGIQFHPEIAREGVEHLASTETVKLARSGVDAHAMAAAMGHYEHTARQHGERLIGGWLDRALQVGAREQMTPAAREVEDHAVQQ